MMTNCDRKSQSLNITTIIGLDNCCDSTEVCWFFVVVLQEYIVLHELHHAMGGLHEQQRNRRKYFVKINWENIQSSYNDQYALSQNTKNNEVYDYASILQYHLTVSDVLTIVTSYTVISDVIPQ